MIDAALVLLDTTDLPSWQEDAPLRRELLRLDEDVRAYRVASYDPVKAAKRAAEVNERADRVRAFLRGHRHGTESRRFWERMRIPA